MAKHTELHLWIHTLDTLLSGYNQFAHQEISL